MEDVPLTEYQMFHLEPKLAASVVMREALKHGLDRWEAGGRSSWGIINKTGTQSSVMSHAVGTLSGV